MLALLSLVLTVGPAEPPASPVAAPGRPANYLTPVEPAPASAEPPPPQATGIRRRGPYLNLSPAGLAYEGGPLFAWGVGAGLMIPRRLTMLLAVGGFVDHLVYSHRAPGFPVPYTRVDVLRAGSELRVGRARSRVFGYGLFRLGFEVALDRGSYFRSAVLATLGGGFQALFGRRWLLGGELAADGLFFVDFKESVGDPPPVAGTLLARVLVGLKF